MKRTAFVLAALTLVVLLAGCKANSATSGDGALPAETTVPETAVAQATAVSQATVQADALPTATPSPTATPEPAGIEIIGDDDFKAWTEQALALIEEKAPDAYEDVIASIDVIESVAAGSGMYVDEKRYAVGDQTAHAPGYDEAGQMIWYAGTIVHDANHSALNIRGEPYSGKDAEVDSLVVQKAALELLTDDPFFANYVQGLIDSADDPASAYWTQPDRHW